MHEDDRSRGGCYTRRELVTLFGASGAVLLAGSLFPRRSFAETAESMCVVRPEQTEGPYFVDETLNRSDLRRDPTDGRVKAGVPLALAFLVSRLTDGACEPLPGARVDVWHCDAQGVYSDVRDPGFNTVGRKFLRGYQTTDGRGKARFTTIYPGWYPGRAVHVHFKIRAEAQDARAQEFTSQLYFDDELTDRVHAAEPYLKAGSRKRNDEDWIFRRGASGDRLLLAPTAHEEGYTATFDVALHM